MNIGDELPLSVLHEGATEWIGEAISWTTEGGVYLIHFWAVSCPLCKMNMPGLYELRDSYLDRGLQLIAVHQPRAALDLDVEKVKSEIHALRMTEPCAIDNKHTIGEHFGVEGYPTYFLFNSEKKMKRRAVGSFGVQVMKVVLDTLLK